ncbi:MAG: TIGR03862 family flavoprotein [Oligoflexia bacterium]|nr:TIGR03862 family flavoprotein [Oligoflexia bacterium]
MMSAPSSRVAIVGTGPAGLMAAHRALEAGRSVWLFEKKRGPGRKLLVAGSSGLNVTYDAPLEEFAAFYGESAARMAPLLREFPPEAWLEFIRALGIGTFRGTSRRCFVEGLKGAPLLRAWLKALEARGARLFTGEELLSFESGEAGVRLRFSGHPLVEARAAVLALGGGSWEPREKPLRWPALFRERGVGFREFEASNVGFEVNWPAELLEEAEGQPLKNIVLRSARGSRAGDLVITRYGLEGTPIYAVGTEGEIELDLKPDLSAEQVHSKLLSVRENLAPIRRVKRFLKLGPAALALVFHLSSPEERTDPRLLAAKIKRFPLRLLARRPLDEAISSSGGVAWPELDERLQLRKFPGIFLAGEMIDWDAPTGGFLIQGCVSSGYVAGGAAAEGRP